MKWMRSLEPRVDLVDRVRTESLTVLQREARPQAHIPEGRRSPSSRDLRESESGRWRAFISARNMKNLCEKLGR